MKILAVNGSPRKNWNTDILLQKALAGAAEMGAQTEQIYLYDLDYKGCRSCMACNRRDGNSFGRCAVGDGLKPVFEKIEQSDGLILGSPIYMGDVSAMMRAFLERLLYQYTNFDDGRSLYPGQLKTGFIYTMNAPAGYMNKLCQNYEGLLKLHFSYTGTVECAQTLQVEDYTKYHLGFFDGEQRHERREKVFPADCQKAFALGRAVAGK